MREIEDRSALNQKTEATEEAFPITVGEYVIFLKASPIEDQQHLYAPAMADQILCEDQGDHLEFSIVDGQEEESMENLTDLEALAYRKWHEDFLAGSHEGESRTTPIMMKGYEKKKASGEKSKIDRNMRERSSALEGDSSSLKKRGDVSYGIQERGAYRSSKKEADLKANIEAHAVDAAARTFLHYNGEIASFFREADEIRKKAKEARGLSNSVADISSRSYSYYASSQFHAAAGKATSTEEQAKDLELATRTRYAQDAKAKALRSAANEKTKSSHTKSRKSYSDDEDDDNLSPFDCWKQRILQDEAAVKGLEQYAQDASETVNSNLQYYNRCKKKDTSTWQVTPSSATERAESDWKEATENLVKWQFHIERAQAVLRADREALWHVWDSSGRVKPQASDSSCTIN